MATKRQAAAEDKVLSSLKAAVKAPGGTTNRAAAEAIIRLRAQFIHEGRPDWAGRSGEYRDCIERLYRRAGVPSDAESNMQANLRYHLGNQLRKLAPPEDLEALGMATEGPLGRVRQARAQRPRKTAARTGVTVLGDPGSLATLALDAVRTLKTVEIGNGHVDGLAGTLRQVIDESLDVLQKLGR